MTIPFKMHTETDLEKYRYETLMLKEPETVAWIADFADGESFYDVGANLGIYSLYCGALHPKTRVYAFEPELNNFHRLCDNIWLNGFDNIRAYHFGMGAYCHLSEFWSSDTRIGNSGGQIVEVDTGKDIKKPVDFKGNRQQCFVMTLDMISKMTTVVPRHVKIDVDGMEWEILQGFKETIGHRNVKSLLVEVNRDRDKIMNFMIANRFTDRNAYNTMDNHSRFRRKGFPENIIFTRR